jgi:PAS domain S-box-containing protein
MSERKRTGGWKTPKPNRLSTEGLDRMSAEGLERKAQESPLESQAHASDAAHPVEHQEMEARIDKWSSEMASLRQTLASLARFRSVIDQADEAIFVIDPETERFVDANQTALRWLGFSREQLLALTIHDVDVEFPLGYPESEVDAARGARELQRPWVCSRVHRRKDGTTFPVEVAIAQRHFGESTYTLVVVRESRQHRQAERVLREAEAVHQVERQEMETQIEKLSGEMSGLKRTLASLARFRTIIDQADEAIFVVDPTTDRFVDVNETALRWLGLTRRQLLSRTIHDVEVEFPLGYAETEAAAQTDARIVQRSRVTHKVHRRRDGSSFPVEVVLAQRRFADRTYTLVVARESRERPRTERKTDTTVLAERREMEGRIEKLSGEMAGLKRKLLSHARFRTIIDQAEEAIFVIDPATKKFVDANETAIRWLRLSREQLLSITTADVDVEFPLGFPEDASQATDQQGLRKSWVSSHVHRRSDGTFFPVEVVVGQRKFGDRTYTLVVARESRRHDEAEGILRETEERYSALFALTKDAVYVTGEDGCIVEVNDAAIELLGYSREELIGLDPRNLYADAPNAREFEANVEKHGFVRDLTVPLLTKGGSVIPGLLTATPRRSTGDGESGFQCLVRPAEVELPARSTESAEPTDAAEAHDTVQSGPQNEAGASQESHEDTVVEAEDLAGSWTQYEEMKAGGEPARASIEDLLGAREAPADTGPTQSVKQPQTTPEEVRKAVEELRRATATAAAAPTTPIPKPQGQADAVDLLRRAAADVPTTPIPRARVDPSAVEDATDSDQSKTEELYSPPPSAPRIDIPRGVEAGIEREPSLEEPPFDSGRTAERRSSQRSSEVEVRTRARIQRRTSALQAETHEERFQVWPLALVLGMVVALVGWTELVALTYGYTDDFGLREWQLVVRLLGLSLLGLGMAGTGWKRTARVISVLVLVVAAGLLVVLASFLANFPFELRDAVPETRRALDNAILQALAFTVAIALFCSWVFWRLWSDVKEPPEPRSVVTGPHQRVPGNRP